MSVVLAVLFPVLGVASGVAVAHYTRSRPVARRYADAIANVILGVLAARLFIELCLWVAGS